MVRFQALSRNGLQAMENAVNSWLDAAAGEVHVVDRQIVATNESRHAGSDDVERYVVLSIWYTKGNEAQSLP